MVLYIGIYIESDWLYHAEWVALSNGQSGSELAEYSTIDEDNQIRSAPMSFTLNPHLRSNRKCIAQNIIIGQQTEDIGGFLAVFVVFYSDTVTDLLIVLVIG